MKKLLNFLEQSFLPVIGKLSEERHLRAIRDGIVTILPLIIVGSFFLLLGQLPIAFLAEKYPHFPGLPSLALWYQTHTDALIMPYRLTMSLMALFASFTIAYRLAVTLGLDALSTAVLSAAAFLLTQTPFKTGEKLLVLPLKSLGGEGLFAAILIALFTAELVYWFKKKNWFFKMPERVPPAVGNAFSALLPAIFLFSVIWLLVHILGFDLVGLIQKAFSPLLILGDTLLAVILINLVMQVIWLSGIHGASVMVAVFLPIWMGYLEANASAFAAGSPLPHLTTLPFYQWFVWIGGSGATLSLVILMLFSRSSYLRNLGKISLIPGLCNINEPIIFGLPMVMNPVFALPFILTPVICGITSYLAISLGLVRGLSLMAPWTLPFFLGAWFSTGLDFRAVILSGFNFLLSGLIYYPFLKSYEKTLLKEESLKGREN